MKKNALLIIDVQNAMFLEENPVFKNKSASACLCPDRQIGKSKEAAPQPPQLCLLRRVTAGALFTFDPEEQGAGVWM